MAEKVARPLIYSFFKQPVNIGGGTLGLGDGAHTGYIPEFILTF